MKDDHVAPQHPNVNALMQVASLTLNLHTKEKKDAKHGLKGAEEKWLLHD